MATDILLAGSGYMVVPGSYARAHDGLAEGRAGRVSQRDFFGGHNRAIQLERDKGWGSPGVGPALGGQGVEPWPNATSWADGVLPAPGTLPSNRRPSVQCAGFVFVASGLNLYRSVAVTNPTWASFTLFAALPAGPVTDLATYQGKVVCLLGDAGDIRLVDPISAVITVMLTGARGKYGVGYARRLVWADANAGQADQLRMLTGPTPTLDSRELDSDIMGLALFGGKVVIATRTSLYFLGGQAGTNGLWTTNPEPVFSGGFTSAENDFAFLLSYGGRLYTWLHNQVMEYRPAGDREGWRAVGIEGRKCLGACVAGGLLVVALLSRTEDSELWAWDGQGWWQLLSTPEGAAGAQRCWPVHLGGAGDRDLVVFRGSSTTYELYRLTWRSKALHTYSTGGNYTSSLLDVGERDKPKAWRKVGAVFAAPDPRGNAASTDASVLLSLQFSLDGGASFITAGQVNQASPTQRVIEIDSAVVSNAATSRFIQLRVNWTSVSDWAPVLVGLWAEYELFETPARRRRWEMQVRGRDAATRRDGTTEPRSGRQLATDLWAAWDVGTTLQFEDIDHEATGTTYAVRIVGLRETVAKPSDAGRWGESTLSLVLVEV